MTDDEWEQQRSRAVLAAFQTGRAVCADSEGELRYADGDHARIVDDVGVPKTPIPEVLVSRSWWTRAKRWLRGRA